MFDGDKLCRSALFPRCAKDGVFDETALLSFSDVNRDKKFWALSLASRFILHTEDEAHAYGTRTAIRANEGIRERTGEEPTRETRVHYLGFYDLYYGDLKRVSLQHYQSSVAWVLEHGENAHFQVEWRLQTTLEPGNKTDKILRRDRQAARALIASRLFGPYKAVIEATSDLINFELPTLPNFASVELST